MAGVAYKGASINSVTASGHVPTRYWNSGYCNLYDDDGNCINYISGYYSNSSASATINGSISSGSSNVYVNGNQVARAGDSTTETDTANVPSGWDKNGGDSGGSGSVSGGVSGVYVNSNRIAVIGSSVSTHASVSTTIKDGSSNVFA